jgi:hypothetical protein
MCEICYRDHGAPSIVNDRTTAAVRLIEAVVEENELGGNLVVIIDDWNIEDNHFLSETVEGKNVTDAERACYAALRKMSVAERASALAIIDGYFTPPSP